MRAAGALVLAALLTACATGRAPAPEVAGYLSPDAIRLAESAATRPPAPGSPEEAADRALSERLRALEDTDRWWMATAHAELRPPWAAQHFDCVLGARLTDEPRPALDRLMNRLLSDSRTLAARLAEGAARARPVAADPARQPCQRLTEDGRRSPSRPAAAAVAGAAYGDLFAALDPDRAGAARRMGHEIGVSRAVCAMAWPSDVAAGEAAGHALFAQAATLPDFRADLDAARAEVAEARADGLASPGCAAERLALAQRTF